MPHRSLARAPRRRVQQTWRPAGSSHRCDRRCARPRRQPPGERAAPRRSQRERRPGRPTGR
eukprot:14121729-Alexandrium_andersonii.AAC.1